jgi:hypothetical protein
MTTSLKFNRLSETLAGLARYSIIRDDKMGPCGYLHIGTDALEIVPLMQAAPELLDALRPFAALGLWEDNYPADSEEWAEAHASNSRLEVWVRPEQVRAARAAIVKAGG